MSLKVRTISVNLNAGTAKFFTDLDAASGKLREFGKEGVSATLAGARRLRCICWRTIRGYGAHGG